MLDAKFFFRVGPKVRDRYREHIFIKAKDVYGKPFKGYSTYGSKWVTMNVKKSFKQSAPKKGYSYNEAKKGKMFPFQSDEYANSNAPVLTSALLTDYSLIRTSSGGFQIGWNKEGAKVNHLAKMGRVLTADNQPLPDKVIRYLSKEAGLYMNKQMPKGTKTYRIGK